MKLPRKWPLIAVLFALELGTYFAARRALGSDLARTQLEQHLSARLGQPVTIGSVNAAFFPQIPRHLGLPTDLLPEGTASSRRCVGGLSGPASGRP